MIMNFNFYTLSKKVKDDKLSSSIMSGFGPVILMEF